MIILKKKTSELYLFILLIVILAFLLIATEGRFFTTNNVMSILYRLSYVMIAAIGMNMIILTSNIDVSAGALVSVVCIVIAAIGKIGAPIPILIVASIIMGAFLSIINALFITKLRIPAIVATLATSQLFAGILPIVVEGSIYDLPTSFTWLGFEAKIFGIIPLSVVIMFFLLLISIFFMRYSKFGKTIYAIGNNEQAARYAGVNVNRTIIIVYAIAGALFGISATIIATVSQRVTTTMGSGLEMVFIASVVLGGTSISGGRGSIFGTFIGAVILSLISPAINYLGINSDWSDAIMGAIIIISVVFSEINNKKVSGRVRSFNIQNKQIKSS